MNPARGPPYGFQYDDELRVRLEKLSRTYDLATMKIFMAVESMGDNNLYSTYAPERKDYWESFLLRREACRVDVTRYDKTREQYQHFLTQVPREAQGQQFFHAMISLLRSKGAVDMAKHPTDRHHGDLEATFCGHLCKLFDQKIEAWFDSFEAVNVRLTSHVKVSNLVRVLNGQVDLLCRKDGVLFAVNIKVTGMPTPRPMDVNELCLVKAMVIQNGLADPDAMGCCLLVCHLAEDRPVLRLWEYRPTRAMDTAIKEADVDHMIDAGKQSQMHELWSQNVCPPGVASLTARLPAYNGAAIPSNMVAKSSHPPQVVGNLNNQGHPTNPGQPYNKGPPNQQGTSRKTPSLVESM